MEKKRFSAFLKRRLAASCAKNFQPLRAKRAGQQTTADISENSLFLLLASSPTTAQPQNKQILSKIPLYAQMREK
ncbi:MAG: hypothetical protein ACI4J7_13770 [Ruminiclostridium sp.]